MIYKKEYTIAMEDIGADNRVTDKALIMYMENVGSLHSGIVGYGVLDIPINRQAWVILDWDVKVLERPLYNETVTATTWCTRVDRGIAYRDYHVLDQTGKVIAMGSSKWLLMNIDTRRPVRINEEMQELFQAEVNRSAFDGLSEGAPKPLVIPSAEDIKEKLGSGYVTYYTVQRRDIDMNKHLHNINYIDVAIEALPEEIYEHSDFHTVQISFKKEIRYGDQITCVYSKNSSGHWIYMLLDQKIHAVVHFE
jgi:medium-chain acyl-[acyl-carrier-protein] hydrolase